MQDEQRILIVDDQACNLAALESTLRKTGAGVVRATDGSGALAACDDHEFALVILDVHMPKMNGYELAEHIRINKNNQHVPIIFLTADQGQDFRGYEAGAVDFLNRPFHPKILISKAQVFLQLDRHKRELQETAARFRSLANNIPGMTYRGRPDWTTEVIFNSAQILGLDAKTFVQNGKTWLDRIHPDDKERVIHESEQLSRRPTSMQQEYRIFNEDGGIRWVEDHKSSRFDEEGNFSGVDGVVLDISQRKQAEKDRDTIEVQLQQAQKLESIGRLAAGIAHEINTPIQYIGDNTRFIQEAATDLFQLIDKYQELLRAARNGDVNSELIAEVEAAADQADVEYLKEEISPAIQQSLEGVDRAAKIVRAMKEFSHPGSDDKTPVNLNHAIESTLTVARNEWKYVAEVVTDFDPNLPMIPCLPGEFNQVILNLIVNASHAIAEVVGDGHQGKGTITVKTLFQEPWAELRIQDTGCGIPEALRNKIFEPFFTTKEVGKGTGQGLAIARSVVVEKHGGKLDFETAPGQGTTFIIHLPTSSEDSPREGAGQ